MGRPIKKDSTDKSTTIRIIDSTSGLPETAVEHDTSGIALWYRREGATQTAITEAALAALDSAHSDGGIEHMGDGYYRLDLPDAAWATGADCVTIGGTITDMIVIGNEHALVDYDPYDAVRMGMTALPNAAADDAGGLPISDAGGLDMDAILADTNELQTDDIPGTLSTNDTSVDTQLAAIKAETALIVADTNELQTDDIPTAIADVPTVAEFEARSDVAGTAATPAEVATALTNYDAPTKAEMDAAHALLATLAKQDIIDTVVDAIKAKTDNQPAGVKKNVAMSNFMFLMVDSADHITPKVGLAVSGTTSGDGGAFGALTNAIAEVSSGWYKVDITQAEMNKDIVSLRFTAAGADTRNITIKTSG